MDTEDLELGRQNARQGVWIGAISLNCPLNYLEGALKTAIAGASQTGGPTWLLHAEIADGGVK